MSDPIPADRVKLEARLIRAFDDPGASTIVRAMRTFDWDEHRELACLGLAEIARRQPPPQQAAVAEQVTAFCLRAAGSYCRRCPLRAARSAA